MSIQNDAQTLFRFVTLRKAESSTMAPADRGNTYITPVGTVEMTGHFIPVINELPAGTSKADALIQAAGSFANPYTSADDVVAERGNLKTFSSWIMQNRTTATAEEIAGKAAGIAPLTDAQLTKVWDNLIYQTVTQRSVSVQDALTNILIGNHVVSGSGEDDKLDLAKSVIVLPVTLFKDEVVVPDTPAPAPQPLRLPVASAAMQQQQAIAKARIDLKSYEVLEAELKSYEKSYSKAYEAARKSADAAYQVTIKPLLTEHAQKLEIERKIFIEGQDPAIPFDKENPYRIPDRVELNLPTFNFSYEPVVDATKLQNALTANSTYALKEALALQSAGTAGSELTTLLAPHDEMTDLYSVIDDAKAKANNVIVANTPDMSNRFASIGGVLIPVGNESNETDGRIELASKTLNDGKVNFDLSIVMPDTSKKVARVITIADYGGDQQVQDNTFSASQMGNKIYLMNLMGEKGITPAPGSGENNKLQAKVFFADGETRAYTLDVPLQGGVFQVEDTPVFTQDFPTATGSPFFPTNWPVNPLSPFVPKGFGYKKLGVADYRKVVQSVHCYVEGEVAHIENIMAREQKMKSTRRLRRTEETTTTSSETEKEQLTDTTTASRFEMQSEIGKILQESKDFAANANFSANYSGGQAYSAQLDAGVNYATHNSKEESSKVAINQAKEITERAMDRIVTKVKEERVQKIMDEFEETYQHGFDNTQGDKHVVGVYRWVDKLYKNQVVNYGQRLMFEFMIPQPAKLHQLGMTELANTGKKELVAPQDPRTSPVMRINDYTKIDDITFAYWAGIYNADVDARPPSKMCLSKTIGKSQESSGVENMFEKDTITIPEDYHTVRGSITIMGQWDKDPSQLHSTGAALGNLILVDTENGAVMNYNRRTMSGDLDRFQKEIGISIYATNYLPISANFTVELNLSTEGINKWKLAAFNRIIEAYQREYDKFLKEQEENNAEAATIKGTNPGFYRQIENTVLRKNCISYLIDDANPNSAYRFGQSMYLNPASFTGNQVNLTQALDNYSSLVRFMEQAFEWDIIGYNLYPFYWGDRSDWKTLYQYDDVDPLFRSFMQAGMARVVVTVRPGFEKAVQYYLNTGKLWNGAEPPVIGDELFVDLVDAILEPKSVKEGKAWITRMPTSLTILQADSIGLKVERALPCNCDDPDKFEDDIKPCSPNLLLNSNQVGGAGTTKARLEGLTKDAEGKALKVVLKKKADGSVVDFTFTNEDGGWILEHLPAGHYDLSLDANNQCPDADYTTYSGGRELTVDLEDGDNQFISWEIKRK